MFKVYWTESRDDNNDYPCSEGFFDDQLSEALKFMEGLRATPNVGFVVMASENPNSVGKAGVAGAGPDYNWEKRRGGSGAPSKGDLTRYKDH
jgi:hypothetical protein